MITRHRDSNTKRTTLKTMMPGAARLLVSLLILNLAFCLFPADTFAYADGQGTLAEDLAVDLYGQGRWTPEGYAARESKPRLTADAGSFAEALVQDYRPVAGTLEITPESRFYIPEDTEMTESLADTLSLIASQFATYQMLGGRPPEIIYGPAEQARAGDIIIRIKSKGLFLKDLSNHLENPLPEEAYELDADESIELTACTEDGIYQGLLTLMQICLEKKQDDSDRITLNRFRISDAPDLAERTIFIDCARKYFSKDWLENFIRRASLQRYNTIVLHFSEAEGIRLDSALFPWLTEGIDSISREEMKEIVQTADQYHMNVIPSIDTPGHNRYMVTKYAEYVKANPDFSFTYDGVTYDRNTKGFKSIANHYSRDGVTLKVTDIGIDITKQHAVAFSNALIDDYADFFRSLGCTDFDLCGDEIMGWSNFMLGENEVSYENRWLFLEHWREYARKVLEIVKGSPSDTFITYLNDVTARLESKGYTCRVFNDEIDINKNQHVELRESVGITCWDLANNSAEHFAEKGHTVYNGVMQWTYYVVRKIDGKDIMKGRYKTVNARNIYENWDPRSFSSKKGKEAYVDADRLGGGYFFIWCDAPGYKSCAKVWKETELRMWANSLRMWNSEINSGNSGIRAAMSYETMEEYVKSLNGFPGYIGDPDLPPVLIEAGDPEEAATLWERSLGNLES